MRISAARIDELNQIAERLHAAAFDEFHRADLSVGESIAVIGLFMSILGSDVIQDEPCADPACANCHPETKEEPTK